MFQLQIALDSRYPGIVSECATAIGILLPRNRIRISRRSRENCLEVASYSKSWCCLLPQHSPGRKHERLIRLEPWQLHIVRDHAEPLLRGLIHSDGCRSINRVRHGEKIYRYPRYTFTNASDDIRGIFCDACDWLGIEWRQMNARNISIARRDAVERLDSFVGPKY